MAHLFPEWGAAANFARIRPQSPNPGEFGDGLEGVKANRMPGKDRSAVATGGNSEIAQFPS